MVGFYMSKNCFAISPIIKAIIETPTHMPSISANLRHNVRPRATHQLNKNIIIIAMAHDATSARNALSVIKKGIIISALVPRYAIPV
jgi:hypothetical protein